ncbi:MAG TPA: hypothetical protein VFS46_08950 [Nitrososphaera sp.]|nr:hypothetical protein [Nitrososphaera sp.]
MRNNVLIYPLHGIVDANHYPDGGGLKVVALADSKDEPSGMMTVEMLFTGERTKANSTINITTARPAATGTWLSMATKMCLNAIYFCPNEAD